MERDFYDWCGLDSDMHVNSANDLLNTTFVSVLNKLKDELPLFISVKKGLYLLLNKGDAGCFCADIDIHGMMNPTKTFLDIRLFSPILTTHAGKIHCHNCGWLYDGNAQCDCWKNDVDFGLEDDDIFPIPDSDVKDNC